jgi:hypothetical protein
MLLLLGSLLMAAAQAPAASAPAPAAPVKTKRVCHVEEAVIGSLTPKRVCVTVPQQAAPAPVAPPHEADRDKQPPQTSSAGGTSN